MFRSALKKSLLLAALVATGLTLSTSSAEAHWGHWRVGYWGWSGWVGYPTYVYTPSCYSPCLAGRGWVRYSSCWQPSPCYVGCGWSCSSWCGFPTCGCSVCSYPIADCGCGATVHSSPQIAPSPAAAPAPAAEAQPAREPSSLLPAPPAADDGESSAAPGVSPLRSSDPPPLPSAPGVDAKPSASRNLPADAALISVVVPRDARVYVNGLLTKTPGAQRQYVSYGLRPGFSYTYEVRVEVTRNGRTLRDTKVVRVEVGQTRELAFNPIDETDARIASRLP